MSAILEFFEKRGCHLCETARPHVERLSRRLDLPLRRFDIEWDDDLLGEYGLRIPVVRLGGTVIAEGDIGYKELLQSAKAVLKT